MPQDELAGLGEIFHPMSAEEQGENRAGGPQLPVGARGLSRPVLDAPRGLSAAVTASSLSAQLAAAQLGPRVHTADQRGYFVRLGDLAPGFRQRAFEHALSHLQHSQFQAREALARLEDSFGAVSLPLPGCPQPLHSFPIAAP